MKVSKDIALIVKQIRKTTRAKIVKIDVQIASMTVTLRDKKGDYKLRFDFDDSIVNVGLENENTESKK